MEASDETAVLEDQPLRELPAEAVEQFQGNQKLRKLSLKNNMLTSLPPIFGTIPKLYYLNLSGNSFEELPLTVCECTSLEILDVSNNTIRRLPRQLSRLVNLKVLSICNNQLRYLSPVLADLPSLLVVETEGNPLIMPPSDFPAADDEDGVRNLQDYLRQHRTELLNAETLRIPARKNSLSILPASEENHSTYNTLLGERARSASEGWLSLRQTKRMGFVMQKNATGSSYVANLHARVLSHDSAMLPAAEDGDPLSPPPPAAEPSTPPAQHHVHTPSESPPCQQVSTLGTLAEEPEPAGLAGNGGAAAVPPKAPVDPFTSGVPTVSTTTPVTTAASTSAYSVASASNSTPMFADRRRAAVESAQVAAVEAFEDVVTAIQQVPAISEAYPQIRTLILDVQAPTKLSLSVIAEICDVLSRPEITAILAQDRRRARSIVGALVPAFAELHTIHRILAEPAQGLAGAESWHAADEQLYIQLEEATRATQVVVSLVNGAVAQSASAAANFAEAGNPGRDEAGLAVQVRELMSTCLAGTASARKVRVLLDQRREFGNVDRRQFWDEVNTFLKAVILMLGTIKTSMSVISGLVDANFGAEVSNLARVAREIPPLLEQSSYKLLLPSQEFAGVSSASSVNPVAMGASMPPTPLTATLGAAASVLSPALGNTAVSPFVPDE